MRPRIFISYSHRDVDFVRRLVSDLQRDGAAVWSDQDILPGLHWDAEIERALHGAPEYLVVLSPSSVESKNVMDELSFAVNSGKRIYPVLYRDCDIPLGLRRVQWVDFRGEYEPAFKQLLSGIRRAEQSAQASSEPHSAASIDEIARRNRRRREELIAIGEWLRDQPAGEPLSPLRLARDLPAADAAGLAASLMILVREGFLRRKFCVMLPDGRFAGGAFADIHGIPAQVWDGGGSVDTMGEELVPVFEKVR
jgi:hypothetical protein